MKLRRSYFIALAVSFVVMVASGLLAYKILASIPSTAFAQQMHFADINHGSPAIYPSQWFREHSPAASDEDYWVTCPVMLLAGLALGLVLAARTTFRETLIYGIVTAVILAVLILTMDYMADIMMEQIARQSGTVISFTFDGRYYLGAGISIVLRTVLYTAGAVLGHLIRSRLSPAGRTAAPGAQSSKPAPTSP